MFKLSLHLEKVLTLWKTSCVAPVPERAHPKEQSNYRPRAMTSHLRMTMERNILGYLRNQVNSALDSLQFECRFGIGVDITVIYLRQWAPRHLELFGGAVRDVFFDF